MYFPFPDTDIYALTDSRQSLGRSTPDVVKAMLAGGIKVIQYREKNLGKAAILRECRLLRELTRQAGCCFIVNDYVDIALLCDADGVHVGQEDIPAEDVRRLIGRERILGVSTHAVAEAEAAAAAGADYIGVGPVYATATKQGAAPVGLDYVRAIAARKPPIPFTAIGGVNERTIAAVAAAGGRCCAVVSAITTAEDIPAKIAELRRLMHGVI